MLEGDGFVFPKKKGRSRRRGKANIRIDGRLTEPFENVKSRLNDCVLEIKGSQFYVDFLDSLNRCLGLLEHVESCERHKTTCVHSERSNDEMTKSEVASGDAIRVSDEDKFIDGFTDVSCGPDIPPGCMTAAPSTSPSTCVIRDIVCYGLGSFSSCLIARYQLALLLVLRENLNVDLNHCHLYDPRFTEFEEGFLQELGLTLIAENEEGRRPCRQTTLFYMPHCDKTLYNNLLFANWGPDLSHVIIIGNSFNSTVQNLPTRILESQANFIQKIVPFTSEEPLKNSFRFSDIFNDTSIHCFPQEKLNTADPELWDNPQEPKYDKHNLGIISKS